jgi:hypothetical protein
MLLTRSPLATGLVMLATFVYGVVIPVSVLLATSAF